MHPTLYLSEAINGSLDGLITTFSLVSASLGGNINSKTLLILGITGLIVDAYSMGVARYLTEKSSTTKKAEKNPLYSSAVLGLSFIVAGAIPIIPLVLLSSKKKSSLYISMAIALVSFFVIGSVKASIMEQDPIKNGIETLLMGLSAAGLSYVVSNAANKLL